MLLYVAWIKTEVTRYTLKWFRAKDSQQLLYTDHKKCTCLHIQQGTTHCAIQGREMSRGRPRYEGPALYSIVSLALWELWLSARVQSAVIISETKPTRYQIIIEMKGVFVSVLSKSGEQWVVSFRNPQMWIRGMVKIAPKASLHLWSPAYLVQISRGRDMKLWAGAVAWAKDRMKDWEKNIIRAEATVSHGGAECYT